MIKEPTITGNPLGIAVGLLAASYVIVEFIVPITPLFMHSSLLVY